MVDIALKGKDSGPRVVLICIGLPFSISAVIEFGEAVTPQVELAGDAPPLGYDSVVGEVGEALNYDELVVYSESAAIPEYLIMYTIT